MPGGVSSTLFYFVRAVDADTFKLYHTLADAHADTNVVDITSSGIGTITVTPTSIILGGTPDLSALPNSMGRLTTTGTSHVYTFDGPHGFTTGDMTESLGGTSPTGAVANTGYYINVLSSTTIRLYKSETEAVNGGASSLNLTGTNIQTLFRGAGLVMQYIYLVSATNSNLKIFPIIVADNTNKTVMVASGASAIVVTGLGGGSDWHIGGRATSARAVDIYNAARACDKIVLNTDISAALNLVWRNVGTVAAVGLRTVGKTGARRVLTNTGNGTLFTQNQTSLRSFFENIEFQSQGTGGAIVHLQISNFTTVVDCRITDSGTGGLFSSTAGAGFNVSRCEITGCATSGIISESVTPNVLQSYIHNNGAHGINATGPVNVVDSIIERNTNTGILQQSTAGGIITVFGSTIYLNGDSGIDFTGASGISTLALFLGQNIFKDNGNTSTEANLKTAATGGGVQLFSFDNCYSDNGGVGGENLIDFEAGSTDLTTDPLFIDPDNGTPASRDFGLQDSSPCAGIEFVFLGSGTSSFRDMGAAQQESGGSSGGGGHILGGTIVR